MLAMVTVAACGSSQPGAPVADAGTNNYDAVHFEERELEECSPRWSSYVTDGSWDPTAKQCEAPCSDALTVQLDDVGDCFFDGTSRFFAQGRSPGEERCNSTFDRDWLGVKGCCIPDTAPVHFVECK